MTKKYFLYGKDLFDQEGIDYNFIFPQIMQAGKAKRSHIEDFFKEDGTSRVPLNSHHVYISYTAKKAAEMNNVQIKHTIATIKALNSVADFKNYFWVNNPDLIPIEISQLPGVEIHLIDELKGFKLYSEVNALSESPNQDITNLVSRTDIIRIIVVREFGGVYCDGDYMIYNPKLLLSYLNAFDFIAGLESIKKYHVIGNAFFASSPNHPIMHEATNLIERNIHKETNKLIPEYIKYPYCVFSKILYEAGPVMFTMAFYKAYNQGNYNNILLPSYFLFNQAYLLANTPESKCYRGMSEHQSLVNYYEGEKIDTIGADPLCGDWSGWNDPTSINQIPIQYE